MSLSKLRSKSAIGGRVRYSEAALIESKQVVPFHALPTILEHDSILEMVSSFYGIPSIFANDRCCLLQSHRPLLTFSRGGLEGKSCHGAFAEVVSMQSYLEIPGPMGWQCGRQDLERGHSWPQALWPLANCSRTSLRAGRSLRMVCRLRCPPSMSMQLTAIVTQPP